MSTYYERLYLPTLGQLASLQFDLKELVSKDVYTKVKEAKTDEERYQYVKNLPEVQEKLKLYSVPFKSDQKDARIAKLWRTKGNVVFSNSRMHESLKIYNACIMHAPFDVSDSATPETSESPSELALGYANRSAVLFKQRKFKECIKDIDRALALNYPAKSQYKLYERYAQSLFALGKYSKIPDILEKGFSALEESDLNEKQRCTVRQTLAGIQKENSGGPTPGEQFQSRFLGFLGKIQQFNLGKEVHLSLEKAMNEGMLPIVQTANDNYFELKNLLVKHFSEMASEWKLKEDEKAKVFQAISDFGRPYETLGNREEQEKPYERAETTEKVHIETDPSSSYPNLSTKCEVKFTPEKGRHIVAKEDIRPGEAIIVEKPFAWAVFQQFKHMFCHHCLVFTMTPVPCKTCPTAMFCSEECRDQSYSYHQYECHCMEELLHESISDNKYLHVALRIATMAGLATLLNHRIAMKLGHFPKSVKTYNILYQSPTHTDEHSAEELFDKTVVALFLVDCLEKGKFFDQVSEIPAAVDLSIDDVKDYVGTLLLRHMQSLQYTSISMIEMEVKKGGEENLMRQSVIGKAAYPTVALLNHSCDPEVNEQETAEGCVVRALASIKAGEEIRMSYGISYLYHPKDIRQMWAQRIYNFTCKCTACVENWSDEKMLLGPLVLYPVWKCPSCRKQLGRFSAGVTTVKCKFCKKRANVEDLKAKLHKTVEDHMNSGHALNRYRDEAEKAIVLFNKHRVNLEKLLCKPSTYFAQVEEQMRKAYAFLGKSHFLETDD